MGSRLDAAQQRNLHRILKSKKKVACLRSSNGAVNLAKVLKVTRSGMTLRSKEAGTYEVHFRELTEEAVNRILVNTLGQND